MADEAQANDSPAIEVPVADAPSPQTEVPSRSEAAAITSGVVGWLVPGLGHALLKMWGRAIACCLAVVALRYIGAGMRGNLFTSEGGDAFATLARLSLRCW